MNENPYFQEPQLSHEPPKPKRRVGAIIVMVLLMLIAISGGAYAFSLIMKNDELASKVDEQNSKITDLDKKVSDTNKTTDIKSDETKTENRIELREFGVSIAVPDSLKTDMTYSYIASPENIGEGSLAFSTKALSDKYGPTQECSSFSAAPPLGTLTKKQGKYEKDLTGPVLVKQFTDFYIAYAPSQMPCANGYASMQQEARAAFGQALDTIKEL